jgi:hypothetical protein
MNNDLVTPSATQLICLGTGHSILVTRPKR